MSRWDYHYDYNGNTILPGGGGPGGKGPKAHPLPSGFPPGGMTGTSKTHQGGAPLKLTPMGGLFYYKFNPGQQLIPGMELVSNFIKRQQPPKPELADEPDVPIPRDEPLNEVIPKLSGQDELVKEFGGIHGENDPLSHAGYDADGFLIDETAAALGENPGEYAMRSLGLIEKSITGVNPLDPKTSHLNKVPLGDRPDYFAEKNVTDAKMFDLDDDVLGNEPELADDITDADLFKGFDDDMDAFEALDDDPVIEPEYRPETTNLDISNGRVVRAPLDAADVAAFAESDLVTNMINHSIDSIQPGSLVGRTQALSAWDEEESNFLMDEKYDDARFQVRGKGAASNPIGTGGDAGRLLHPMEGDPTIETLTKFQLKALDIADQRISIDRTFNTLQKKSGGGYKKRPANQQSKLDMKLEYTEMVENSGYTNAELYQPGTNKFKSEFSWGNFIKDLQEKRTRITGKTAEEFAVQRGAKGPEMGDADTGLDPFEDDFNLDSNIETGRTGFTEASNAEIDHIFGTRNNASDLTGGIGDMEFNTTKSLGIDTSEWSGEMIDDFDMSIRAGRSPAETFRMMDRALDVPEGTMAGNVEAKTWTKLDADPFTDIVKPGEMIEGFGKNVPQIGGNWGSDERLGKFEDFDIGKQQAQLEEFGEMGEVDLATEFVAEYGMLGSEEAARAFGILMEMGNVGMTIAAAWQATQIAMDGVEAFNAGEKWHPIGKFKVPFTEFWKDGGVDPDGALHSAIHLWLTTTFGPGAGDIAMSLGETLYKLFAGDQGYSEGAQEDEWMKQLGYKVVEDGDARHDVLRLNSAYHGVDHRAAQGVGKYDEDGSKILWENEDGKIYERSDILEYMPMLDMTTASDAEVLDLMYKRMDYKPNKDGSWTAPMGQHIPVEAMNEAFKLPVTQTHQYRSRESHWNDWKSMVFYEHTEDQEWQDAPPIASSIWDFFSEITHPPTDPSLNPYNLEWGDTWVVGDYGEKAMIHTKIYDNAEFTNWWESGGLDKDGHKMTTWDVKNMSHDEAAEKYEYFTKSLARGGEYAKWGYEGDEYHDVGLRINADFPQNFAKYTQQQNEEMMERSRIHAAETKEQNRQRAIEVEDDRDDGHHIWSGDSSKATDDTSK